MLTAVKIANLRFEHKDNNSDFKNTDEITFREAYDMCKNFISNNAKKSYALKEGVDAKEESIRLIDNFVNGLKVGVEGYGTSSGSLDKLRKALKDEIVDYRAITELMNNEDVGEIRINGMKTIYYEEKGILKPWTKNFNSNSELDMVLSKLLGDNKRLSRSTPFLNGRSLEGYRINATDKSISPSGDYTCVIRKFLKEENKLSITDIVGGRSLTDNMANLVRILPPARFSFLTVGSTGSGKTVTNEILAQGIKPMDRQVYIENPSEITAGIPGNLYSIPDNENVENLIERLNKLSYIIYTVREGVNLDGDYLVSVRLTNERHAEDLMREILGEEFYIKSVKVLRGIYVNDFVQLEANSDKKDPSATDPTPNNLVENSLRMTPIWIVVGECRSDEEFMVLLKAAQTGHKVITTFHADDPKDAMRRYLVACMSGAGNIPAELVLETITSNFDFIINVEKLHDGSRRIMYITEVLGSEGLKPILKDIYIYDLERVDEDNKVHGRHKRVGRLSDRVIIQMRRNGIPDNRFSLYTEEVTDQGEVETYNGLI